MGLKVFVSIVSIVKVTARAGLERMKGKIIRIIKIRQIRDNFIDI